MNTCAEPRTAIQIFARAPVPGTTKTRLIPHIGAEAAARLARRMTERAIEAACGAGIGPVQLWCTPTATHPFFLACARHHGLQLHEQVGAALGERLRHAHRNALANHHRVLLIGTDCPLLDAQGLQAAASGLDTHGAVIIPAEDGGYVLLGLRGACDAVFTDIDWGSSRVLEQTIGRLRLAGRTFLALPPLWDVDRAEDFARLLRAHPDLAGE